MPDIGLELLSSPEAWAAFLALVTLEIVLGIDNLIFLSLITNKLPEAQRPFARRLGLGLALGLRLALLGGISYLVGLSAPVIDLGFTGTADSHGNPSFETAFSIRDLILIAGGLFLIWKATREIHHKVDSGDEHSKGALVTIGLASAIVQIILLDLVFSIDSILTAVGMTTHLPIMVAAVVVAVGVMLLAAEPVSRFISRNPTVVMLALAFLLMVGMVLVADGFGVHVPKGYIYVAMAFAMSVEVLNILARRKAA
ncbi:MAG: TerC family protein [Rhizobiales bacterium]|nr:TerC family protein [Hyphomicrobiales bacterium]